MSLLSFTLHNFGVLHIPQKGARLLWIDAAGSLRLGWQRGLVLCNTISRFDQAPSHNDLGLGGARDLCCVHILAYHGARRKRVIAMRGTDALAT